MTDMENANRPKAPYALTSLTAAQLALYAGWTIAVLYGAVQRPVPGGLPTVHELPLAERRAMELGRLQQLLDLLTGLPGELKADAERMKANDGEFLAHVRELHLAILGALATVGPGLELAYELGRSLRDTADPRQDPPAPLAAAVTRQLARDHVAVLQEWLATLSTELPEQAAAIVGTSLGRWSDFAGVTSAQRKIADKEKFAGQMRDYLLRQGDVWLMLLVGARSTDGLLTPESFVTAAEAALRRSARIVRGVLAHYWAAALCLAAALGGVLYLAIAHLGGAGQVWTSIAAIGSTMGISARSIRSAISRLSSEAERPVLIAAEEDAKAWAITTLPPAGLTVGARAGAKNHGVQRGMDFGQQPKG